MRFLIGILGLLLFNSCGDGTVLSPKPRAYPRVDYPVKEYKIVDFDDCPFAAEVPIYAEIVQVRENIVEQAENDCWFNIVFPGLNATIHLSYVPISSRQDFEKFRSDTYTIVNQINKNSTYMAEIPFSRGKGLGGIIFDFEGAAASPYQFYITDSLSQNLRGSLYINSEVRLDSLAPVVNFLEKDVEHFVNTFSWK